MAFFATIIAGLLEISEMGSKSFSMSYGRGVDSSVHDVRAPLADAKRVAVGRRPGDPADADAAGCARHVFRDYRLAERGRHMLSQECSAKRRPITSDGPPAGNGTTIGFLSSIKRATFGWRAGVPGGESRGLTSTLHDAHPSYLSDRCDSQTAPRERGDTNFACIRRLLNGVLRMYNRDHTPIQTMRYL